MRRRALKRWAVFQALRILHFFLGLLPLAAGLGLGRLLGKAAGKLAGRSRSLAEEQLGWALGVSPEEARRISGRMFEHLGLSAAELLLAPKIAPHLREYVRLDADSRATLDRALAQKRGVLGITAHLGNWELLGQRLALEGYDLAGFARANVNPYLGAWLVDLRRRQGVDTIDRDRPVRGLLSALRRGAVVAALIDQDTRVASVFVPFFGRLASTPAMPMRIALRRGLPVVWATIAREEGGHRIRVEQLDLNGVSGSDEDERVRAATALVTARIEAAIRERPAEWVWFHRRWKTQAPNP